MASEAMYASVQCVVKVEAYSVKVREWREITKQGDAS
jgi:hypothetical protein